MFLQSFAEPGGGPLRQESKADKQEKKDEAFWDRLHDLMGEADERKRQEEHARKWDNETHDIAGTRMSGHDFMEMRAYLKSEQGRKKVQEELIRKGMSKEEAEKATKKADEYNDLTERLRRGEKLKPEEELRRQELQRDRDVKEAVQTTNEQANKRLNGLDSVQTSGASVSSNSTEATAKSAEPATDTRYFSNAPILTGEFAKAKAAVEPLDNMPVVETKKYASSLSNTRNLDSIGLGV